jgi:hypothetical protein
MSESGCEKFCVREKEKRFVQIINRGDAIVGFLFESLLLLMLLFCPKKIISVIKEREEGLKKNNVIDKNKEKFEKSNI